MERFFSALLYAAGQTVRMPITQFQLKQQLRTFGAALRRARKRAKVSKRQMASAFSRDRSAITKIEDGQRAPNFSTLLVLAREAQTTPAKLLAGIGPKRSSVPRPRYEGGPPSDPLKRFGANLKWAREHSPTCSEPRTLAAAAKVDLHSLVRYEAGEMAPNLRRMLKLAGALEISPGLLFEGVQAEG